MAKLSAHGTEVFRLVRETTLTPKDDIEPLARKVSISIRSDLAVMSKHATLFQPMASLGETSPKWHDYGWKLQYRGSAMKANGYTAEKLRDLYLSKGFTLDV